MADKASATPPKPKHTKNILGWHLEKLRLDGLSSRRIYFSEREVWWAAVGHNIGFETDGKNGYARPVLVIKKFNEHLFIGVPLSTTTRRSQYDHPFAYQSGVNSVALLSQVRCMSSRRLINKDGVVSEPHFTKIKERIVEIIVL